MRFSLRVVLLALVSCSSSAGSLAAAVAPPAVQDPGPVPQADPTAPLRGLVVATGDLVPAFDPTVAEYTLTANGSLFPTDVTASADAALTVAINGQPATTDVASSVTLSPGQDIVVTLSSTTGGASTYVVHYAPPELPAYTVATPGSAGNERLLLTPDHQWLLVTDRQAKTLYYRQLSGLQVTAFEEHLQEGGARVYSYITQDTGGANGRVHLLDDHFRETASLALLPNRDHGELGADLHDFVFVGDQHYVLVAYQTKTVDLSGLNAAWPTDAKVVAGVIQEIDHGHVVFEWASTDAPSLFSDSVFGNTYGTAATDYVHLNAVQIDPEDGNFLVSLRHTDSVLKLDRKTGATIWNLGGKSDAFGVTAEQRFVHQHHVRKLDDGTFTIFDNGNDVHPSRAIAMKLDEAARKVTSFETILQRPDGQADTTFLGSVFRLGPERYVIGWGGHTDTSTAAQSVTEVVDGAPVWSLTFTDPKVFSYRAVPMAN